MINYLVIEIKQIEWERLAYANIAIYEVEELTNEKTHIHSSLSEYDRQNVSDILKAYGSDNWILRTLDKTIDDAGNDCYLVTFGKNITE